MLESLAEYAENNVPATGRLAVTKAILYGEIGLALLPSGNLPRFADLQLFCIPALKDLGIELTIQESTMYAIASPNRLSLYVSQTPILFVPEPPEVSPRVEQRPTPWVNVNPFVRGVSIAEADQAYVATLQPTGSPLPKARRLAGLLMRCCAFEASRLQEGGHVGTPAVAECLEEWVGADKGPVSVRMRRAAKSFAAGDNRQAWLHLSEALCLQLQLPSALQAALLSPPDVRLDPIHRRELIYCARSGTACLRAMAAARLAAARANYEVARTLYQLCYDSDAWVRSAAGIGTENK